MSFSRLWRYGGPVAAVLTPFLLFAGPQGIPNGKWWDAPGDPAVWITTILCAAAVVYNVLQLVGAPDEERATIKLDIEQLARRTFVYINRHLPNVRINQLGVHVWTTDGDRLKRLVKYTMEQQRATTPITWTRGKGVIGLAWRQKRNLIADLTDIYAKADTLDPAAFEALDPEERYGLSAAEIRSGGRYKSVLACPLTDEQRENEVIGVLSVDCSVVVPSAALEALLYDREFQDVLGSCESALRRYLGR
jgi:hypothetical protein